LKTNLSLEIPVHADFNLAELLRTASALLFRRWAVAVIAIVI
jgi:hypothetical protein